VHWLYSLLWYLLLPVIMLRLWWRGRRAPGYRRRWGERLGYVSAHQAPACIWVHAVSVGEVQAAVPIVRALRSGYADRPLVLTTVTATGSERVRQALGDEVIHTYAPYDLPAAVQRFIRAMRPRLLLLMETELWPNLIRACRECAIPVIVVNARMSPASARRYRLLGPMMREMLGGLELIAAQSSLDAERFLSLGATPARVQVTGNVKFDLRLPPSLLEQAQFMRLQWGADRAVWVAASTHEREEELVLDAFAQVRQHLPHSLLVLVPRHPERFDRVEALCRRRGHSVVRRTSHAPCGPETAIFLGDSMGELPMFYAAADIAFVGGSLVPAGGHNLVEPGACGIPVLFGPHVFNFQEIAGMFLQAGGAVQVPDAEALADTLTVYLQDATLRVEVGERARSLVDANRGALGRLMGILEPYLRDAQERLSPLPGTGPP
jgi:3-deoxy-D-manno-octulosonic-acid transferase